MWGSRGDAAPSCGSHLSGQCLLLQHCTVYLDTVVRLSMSWAARSKEVTLARLQNQEGRSTVRAKHPDARTRLRQVYMVLVPYVPTRHSIRFENTI
jgi:hypothetical protein